MKIKYTLGIHADLADDEFAAGNQPINYGLPQPADSPECGVWRITRRRSRRMISWTLEQCHEFDIDAYLSRSICDRQRQPPRIAPLCDRKRPSAKGLLIIQARPILFRATFLPGRSSLRAASRDCRSSRPSATKSARLQQNLFSQFLLVRSTLQRSWEY